MNVRFYKYHGLGNDFVLTPDLDGTVEATPERAVRICNRHTGIGADGWMLVRRSDLCDIQMFLYNSDGSVAEMCGNGLRCFAKFIYDRGIVQKEQFTVETIAGVTGSAMATGVCSGLAFGSGAGFGFGAGFVVTLPPGPERITAPTSTPKGSLVKRIYRQNRMPKTVMQMSAKLNTGKLGKNENSNISTT